MEALVDEIHAAPTADGTERLLVPGEMEWERHAQAVRDGINLPSDVVAKLVEAAAASGVPLPFPKH
jgi:LDH2 family malate/lactate/ureidoglycolate dehydrogenase